MLTVHFIRECSILTVEPYQVLTVFILFHDMILPEKVYSILIFPPRASLDISFFETYHEKRNYFPGFPPHGRMNKMLKTVFWDWNGTTVADVPLVVRTRRKTAACSASPCRIIIGIWAFPTRCFMPSRTNGPAAIMKISPVRPSPPTLPKPPAAFMTRVCGR